MIERPMTHDQDAEKAANGEDLSFVAAGLIRTLGIDRHTILDPFLGLAAGMGVAERSLAQEFALRDITLVDRDLENLHGFTGTYIPSDLFEFIKNTRKKFGLVTVFGLEYVLNMPDMWKSLWQGLEKITRRGSIVLTYPHENNFTLPSGATFEVKNGGNIFIAQRTIKKPKT